MKIINRVIFLFAFFYNLYGQSYNIEGYVILEGYVLLENGNNPDSIKVHFPPLVTFTNPYGYFSLNVLAGQVYNGNVTKEGYFPEHLYSFSIQASTILDTIILKEYTEVNPYIQPNDSTLAWYGSGDVDGDNDVDWNDYNAMFSILNDMADIDGDGISSTVADQQLLSNYLNGAIGYLPGQWNNLQSREERIDWLDKMLTIDLTDTITYRSVGDYPDDYFVCGNFSTQTYINFHGFKFENQDEIDSVSTRYIVDQNGRFNIPVYYFSFSWPIPYVNHARNACLVGDDPLSLYDWAFADQQNYGPLNHLSFLGENWNPSSPNASMGMYMLQDALKHSNHIFWGFYRHELIRFSSDSTGVLTLDRYNPKLLLTRPTVAIEDDKYSSKHIDYYLQQNYPNPFNPSTTIHYTLPKEARVSIIVYDMLGEEITKLTSETQPSGTHSVQWNGTNHHGTPVSAGIYFYQLQAGDFVQTKKMVLMK